MSRNSTRGLVSIYNPVLLSGSIYGSRFRMMVTFGHDTIRRFANNVSKMKKLAARDFEDILQVFMTPVFVSPYADAYK
jgi:hypothetical protein